MRMENPENKKQGKGVSGLLLVGCLFIGLGLGVAFDFMPEGLFFGLGAGFIVMAIWRYTTKEW
jgi:hypothetical protein